MAQYLSNEGLVYGVIRRGKDITRTRSRMKTALYVQALTITFDDDFNPTFDLADSHWTKDIDRTKASYLDVMQSMYFDAYEFLVEKIFYYEGYNPDEDRLTPREDLELMLKSLTQRYGNIYYMSQFLAALLKTDFTERKGLKKPEYTYRNL